MSDYSIEEIESWSRERLENEYISSIDRLEKAIEHNEELIEKSEDGNKPSSVASNKNQGILGRMGGGSPKSLD